MNDKKENGTIDVSEVISRIHQRGPLGFFQAVSLDINAINRITKDDSREYWSDFYERHDKIYKIQETNYRASMSLWGIIIDVAYNNDNGHPYAVVVSFDELERRLNDPSDNKMELTIVNSKILINYGILNLDLYNQVYDLFRKASFKQIEPSPYIYKFEPTEYNILNIEMYLKEKNDANNNEQ